MDLRTLYVDAIRQADPLLDRLGVREELVQNDTMCLEVPTNERYTVVRAELMESGELISESEINGRLIAVFELRAPLRVDSWAVSFVELPQPKAGVEGEGVRHLQFVTRTGIESFRNACSHLDFAEKGNPLNRLLEVADDNVVLRFHDKSMGAVIDLEKTA